MARIKPGFSNFTDAELLAEAARIIAAMTGNPHFAGQVPPLYDLKEAYATFDIVMSAIANGKKGARIFKNKTRAALERLLGELALYVQLRSKGDEIILQSSGYALVNKSKAMSVWPKPFHFIAMSA